MSYWRAREPEGYMRTFVDEGPLMAALLHAAYARAIMPSYVATLLAAFAIDADSKRPSAEQSAPLRSSDRTLQPLVEPLSKRELEILVLIAQGLTNPEIGQQIYISAQTVKVHTRNIFGKLGVNDRRQAVNRARSLGLLP